MIVTRWWDQYVLLPWPDSIAMFIVGLMKGLYNYDIINCLFRFLHDTKLFYNQIFLIKSRNIFIGTDDRGRLMRRNFIRYIMLSYVITLRKVNINAA